MNPFASRPNNVPKPQKKGPPTNRYAVNPTRPPIKQPSTDDNDTANNNSKPTVFDGSPPPSTTKVNAENSYNKRDHESDVNIGDETDRDLDEKTDTNEKEIMRFSMNNDTFNQESKRGRYDNQNNEDDDFKDDASQRGGGASRQKNVNEEEIRTSVRDRFIEKDNQIKKDSSIQLESNLKKVELELEKEKQKNNTLNEEIKRYREEAVHYKAENNTLRGQIKSLQEQSGQSEQLQAKDETISQLQSTIEEIKNNFGASDNDEIMEEFQNYKEETDRALNTFKKQIEQRDSHIQSLTDKIDEINGYATEAGIHYQGLLEKADKHAQQLTEQITLLNQLLQEKDRAIANLVENKNTSTQSVVVSNQQTAISSSPPKQNIQKQITSPPKQETGEPAVQKEPVKEELHKKPVKHPEDDDQPLTSPPKSQNESTNSPPKPKTFGVPGHKPPVKTPTGPFGHKPPQRNPPKPQKNPFGATTNTQEEPVAHQQEKQEGEPPIEETKEEEHQDQASEADIYDEEMKESEGKFGDLDGLAINDQDEQEAIEHEITAQEDEKAAREDASTTIQTEQSHEVVEKKEEAESTEEKSQQVQEEEEVTIGGGDDQKPVEEDDDKPPMMTNKPAQSKPVYKPPNTFKAGTGPPAYKGPGQNRMPPRNEPPRKPMGGAPKKGINVGSPFQQKDSDDNQSQKSEPERKGPPPHKTPFGMKKEGPNSANKGTNPFAQSQELPQENPEDFFSNLGNKATSDSNNPLRQSVPLESQKSGQSQDNKSDAELRGSIDSTARSTGGLKKIPVTKKKGNVPSNLF